MRKLLQILIISCSLTGCIMTHNSGLHNIINENIIIYQISERVEFTNIAAILKSYAHLINAKDYTDLLELTNDTTQFINGLKGNPISNNYPVVASKTEIRMVNRFLNDLTQYIDDKDIKPNNFQEYVNKAAKVYITEIAHYEQIH